MATVTNPTGIDVTDTVAASQGVTNFKILVGTASGGPYTTSSATIPLSAMTNNAGSYTAPLSALTFSPALANFTVYFAVSEAVNSTGASGGSPEASFQIQAAPTAPTAFSFS